MRALDVVIQLSIAGVYYILSLTIKIKSMNAHSWAGHVGDEVPSISYELRLTVVNM